MPSIIHSQKRREGGTGEEESCEEGTPRQSDRAPAASRAPRLGGSSACPGHRREQHPGDPALTSRAPALSTKSFWEVV